MENIKPSKLTNLQELVSLLGISVQIQGEISGLLEEYHSRIFSLEEDRKRLLADYKALHTKTLSLERRYSEILYKLSDLKKD